MVEVYFIATVSERSFYSVVLVTYKHLLRRAVKKKSEQLFHVFINTLPSVDSNRQLKYPLVNCTAICV